MTSYKRAYDLNFVADDGTQINLQQTNGKPGLMIDFEMTKSLTQQKNYATIGITNASRDTAAALGKDGIFSLKCGYHPNLATQPDWAEILVGSRETIGYEDDGANKRIEIRILEGSARYENLDVSFQYGQNTSNLTVINDLVKHIVDNVPSVRSANDFTIDNIITYSGTQVVTGDAYDKLAEMLNGIDYEYFVNKGVLTILKRNGFTRETEVPLNPESGLIGTPRPIVENDPWKFLRYGIEVQSILNYNFDVGRRIRVNSKDYNNKLFICDSVTFTGNSFEGDWMTTMKLYEPGQ